MASSIGTLFRGCWLVRCCADIDYRQSFDGGAQECTRVSHNGLRTLLAMQSRLIPNRDVGLCGFAVGERDTFFQFSSHDWAVAGRDNSKLHGIARYLGDSDYDLVSDFDSLTPAACNDEHARSKVSTSRAEELVHG